MGTEPTPIEVTPRWSNSRAQNVQLVQRQLFEAGKILESYKFLTEYGDAQAAYRRGELSEHPVTSAARTVGANVRWVK
jgi:hypothetical protein